MSRKSSGKWRTLDDIEIALAKRMKLNSLPRDYICSFFVRPGRVISPAFVSELDEKRPDIPPATEQEVEAYISRRLNESNSESASHGFGPTSPIRVREVLQLSRDGQNALPGFESHFAEFKAAVPDSKIARAKIAKALVSFANHEGGYVFIGVADDGKVIGVPDDTKFEKMWDEISDVITRHFTPFFRWDRNVVEFSDQKIAVAYAYQATERPVIASDSFTAEIAAGQIFFRYSRSSEAIRPGDLLRMLYERDHRVAAGGPFASVPGEAGLQIASRSLSSQA